MIQHIAAQAARLELQGFATGVSNPEDLVDLPGSSWIVVSGMRSARHPGRLFVVDAEQPGQASELRWTSSAEAARVSAEVFDPHGIAARRLGHRRYELLAVDHGGGEAIDRLTLEIGDDGPVAVAGDRIVQPAGTSANAVAYMPDGGFVMTSMFDPADPDTRSKFGAGENTGQVWRWSPDEGWSRFGGLQLSGANGIAAAPDGTAVAVCEWAARRVWRLRRDGTPAANVRTDFLPDNLRWTADGQLLLAGQADQPERVFGCEARGEPCPLAFKVVRLNPANLDVVPLITADEARAAELKFGGATGALEVRSKIWVGSFTGERIAIFANRS
jgi:sugar lactone lactonase YvrE